MPKIIKELVPEKAIFKPNAPAFCTNPELLDNMVVEYERECKIDDQGHKVSCKVVATVVTVGKGTEFEKKYRVERPLSSSEVISLFRERCDCGCARDYQIHF